MSFFTSLFGIIREETPSFQVVRTLPDGAELRKYAARTVARVAYRPSLKGTSSDEESAFFTLAKYLGVIGEAQNTARQAMDMTAPVTMGSEKIAMTAPVTMGSEKVAMTAPVTRGSEKSSDGSEEMEFMEFHLPGFPERIVAVRQFSGLLRKPAIDAQGALLIKALQADGDLTPVSDETMPWYHGGFNPPWTLPFMRTNEVYIDVLEGGAGVHAKQASAAAAIPAPFDFAHAGVLWPAAVGALIAATIACTRTRSSKERS